MLFRTHESASPCHHPDEVVVAGPDCQNYLSLLHPQDLDTLGLLYRLTALGESCPTLDRHMDRGCRIGRYSRAEGESISLDAPGTDDLAANRVVLGPRVRQAASRARVDQDAAEARRFGVDASHVAVEPLAHRSQRVVVEGVHVGRLEAVLLSPTVPALPDRGSPVLYGVAPGGVGFVLQQAIGDVRISDLR